MSGTIEGNITISKQTYFALCCDSVKLEMLQWPAWITGIGTAMR